MNTTDLPTPVAEYLATNRTELFEFAETLVGIDSQNPPGGTTEIIDWIATTFEETAVAVERFQVDPEKPNLVGTLDGSSDRTLCFNGHVDTVPFDGSDWSHDPLGERDGDRIYGRGTTDMKGAVAAMVQVALAYARTGTEPPVSLSFAFVSDEETGGDAGLQTLLETTEFDPDACVVGETTARNGRHSVSVADRGNIWLTLEASGTAAHGSRPMIGENAIDRLTEAVDHLRTDFGQRELSIESSMEPIIAIKTVPASACARVDIRLTAGVDTGEALGGIRDCLREMDGIEITDLSWTRGSYEPIGSPIAEASATAAEHVVEDTVYQRSATGGGDAKVLRHRGIPTVEFGFGTQTAHGTDEYTTETALVRNVTSYATIPVLYDRFADDS
jgi:succinyl-diaminopimelate desuccinylase